jgi:hypothetical protein
MEGVKANPEISFRRSPSQCHFDVLRILKTCKFPSHETRTVVCFTVKAAVSATSPDSLNFSFPLSAFVFAFCHEHGPCPNHEHDHVFFSAPTSTSHEHGHGTFPATGL